MTAVVESGQKYPAAQGVAVGPMLPVAKQYPAVHAEHKALPPELEKVPTAHSVAALDPAGQYEPAGHCA